MARESGARNTQFAPNGQHHALGRRPLQFALGRKERPVMAGELDETPFASFTALIGLHNPMAGWRKGRALDGQAGWKNTVDSVKLVVQQANGLG